MLIVVVALSVGLSSSFLASRMMHNALESELRNQAEIAARFLAKHISHTVINNEVLEARDALSRIAEQSQSIQYAYIVDFDGRVFAHTFEGGFPKALAAKSHQHDPASAQSPEMVYLKTNTGRILEISYPLVKGMMAYAHIGMDQEGTHTQIATLQNSIIGLTLLLVALSITVAILVSRRITRPLSGLADAMRDFGKREKGVELEFKSGGTEMAHLTQTFNRMISERKTAEKALLVSEAKFRGLVESTSDWIWEVNAEGVYTYASPQVEAILGYKPEEVVGKTPFDLMPVEEAERIAKVFKVVAAEGKPIVALENVNLYKNGQRITFETSGVPVLDAAGQVTGYRGIDRDITERKRMEDELKHLATHDPLTGLHNRNLLEQRINDEINRATRYNRTLTIFMLDIDHFKQVNDAYGHQAGDTVLRSFARVLNDSVRTTDYTARYGGEEFVIILPEMPLPKAKELAERLRNEIAEHSILLEAGRELNISVSVGIATYPEHAQSWEDLLKAADSAMYAAKDGGRNCVRAAENAI